MLFTYRNSFETLRLLVLKTSYALIAHRWTQCDVWWQLDAPKLISSFTPTVLSHNYKDMENNNSRKKLLQVLWIKVFFIYFFFFYRSLSWSKHASFSHSPGEADIEINTVARLHLFFRGKKCLHSKTELRRQTVRRKDWSKIPEQLLLMLPRAKTERICYWVWLQK